MKLIKIIGEKLQILFHKIKKKLNFKINIQI